MTRPTRSHAPRPAGGMHTDIPAGAHTGAPASAQLDVPARASVPHRPASPASGGTPPAVTPTAVTPSPAASFSDASDRGAGPAETTDPADPGADPTETAGWAGPAGQAGGGGGAPLAPRARLLPALDAVYRAQLSRARVARIPLLFVATFQSVGIMILMRGVVADPDGARAVVAGSSVLVVAFVGLNLLAQYFGQLRAGGGLDHYATLPVPPAAVVLGTAAAYASFTAPGTAVTAAIGCLLFQLPLTHLWILVAVIPLAGAALSGLGAALGLLAPRPELATLLGQLGMSAALLLGVLPAGRLPLPVRFVRDLLPSTYGVEAFERTFPVHPDWPVVGLDLLVCAAVGVVSLAVATWAYRRAAVR